MLNLIQNLRFDRNKNRSSFSFKKDLENYNTSELLGSKHLKILTLNVSQLIGYQFIENNKTLVN